MERYLQALDELDDFLIGLRQASLPWLAMLLASALRAGIAAGHCTRAVADVCARLALRLGVVRSAHVDLLDLGLASGPAALSVRNVTE
jgi:hypothetical protein